MLSPSFTCMPTEEIGCLQYIYVIRYEFDEQGVGIQFHLASSVT